MGIDGSYSSRTEIRPDLCVTRPAFNLHLILPQPSRNSDPLLYSHWGGNRPRQGEGPTPETGHGFFAVRSEFTVASRALRYTRCQSLSCPRANSQKFPSHLPREAFFKVRVEVKDTGRNLSRNSVECGKASYVATLSPDRWRRSSARNSSC